MKEIYQTNKRELLADIDISQGLSSEKAKEIIERDGENVLKESEKMMQGRWRLAADP